MYKNDLIFWVVQLLNMDIQSILEKYVPTFYLLFSCLSYP